MAAPDVEVVIEDGLRKAVCGYTWPGIEFGEPPSCAYTFFEYVDTLTTGDVRRFEEVEAACCGWWFPTLDRDAGAALHFAVDHGQLAAVRHLVERRGAEVNQQDRVKGWTPLHRAARVAHYQDAPRMEVCAYLLSQGADPALPAFPGVAHPSTGEACGALLPVDVAVQKGHGWEPGQVRARLAELITAAAAVPKKPAFVYRGPRAGPGAVALLRAWEALPPLYPPPNWRPPPPAGYVSAQGVRPYAPGGWRPAGDGDGSSFVRPMTEEELQHQAQTC